MSRIVGVDLGERSYEIRVGRDLTVGTSLQGRSGTVAMLVSDTNVDGLYGAACQGMLEAAGCRVVRATVPAGEDSKNLAQAEALYDKAIEGGLDRSSVVVALGGGMVGDLAGFVAATFHRGIDLIQVPTTLLAMVDSSVGGKTAVNLAKGKNLVGVFHQPVEVVADLHSLGTLPDREFRSGLGEVVKYGVIWDAVLFRTLENNPIKILSRDPVILEEIIARCCEIKAEVVKMDERDTGVRSILNFGHTMGHAIEKVLKYGTLLHGEAVAAGMAYAAHLSVLARDFDKSEADRILALLKVLGLPSHFSDLPAGLTWPAARDAISRDKKTVRKAPRFVLAERIGQVLYGCEVQEDLVEKAYGEWACLR